MLLTEGRDGRIDRVEDGMCRCLGGGGLDGVKILQGGGQAGGQSHMQEGHRVSRQAVVEQGEAGATVVQTPLQLGETANTVDGFSASNLGGG